MVNAGDTVVWINQGGFHNVNGSTSTFPSNPASFGNGTASASWAYSFAFSIPGTYSYQCDPHAGLGMSGTVTVNAAPAPAALNPGDIVFAGFQADAPDGFAIIPMVDLPGNLDISFTDRSWGPSSTNGGTFDWYSTTGEDTMTWTTPAGGVSAGTYIRFEDPSSGSDALIFGAGGTTVGSLGGISGSGDNIFCYLGSIPNPSFVAGIMTPRSNNINLTWLTSGLAASTESYLPPSLTDGFSAFVMASAHVDNGYYDCSLSVGDTVTLRSNIYNAGNWVTDDDVNIAGSANWPACNLTFGSAPTTSTVSFSTSSQSISESVGSLALTLQFSPTTTADDTVIVTLTPGIGLDPTDGSTAPAFDLITGEILIPVTAGTDSAQIILTVVDDAIVESSETGTFDITYVSGGLAAGSNTSVAITILDNDGVSTGCSDLFFSEYIEGSSNNKGLEIYNPTSTMIDLTNYLIIESGNGGSFTDTLDLSGMLAPGAVYTLCTDQADPAMQNIADTVLSFPSVAHFNGDDALILWNGTDTLDIIGVPGVDPGSSWPVGTGSTQNHTLIRNINIQEGTTDWSIGATQWDVNPQDFFSDFGGHIMTPCGGGGAPIVSFQSIGQSFSEDLGTVQFNVNIANADANPTSVDVTINGGTATAGTDYTFTSPTTVTFPGGSSSPQTVSVMLTDDALNEGNETITFQLLNATNGASIVGGTFTLVITDNDQVIPTYSIGDVTSNAADGSVDSALVYCAVEGIVLGVNMNANGAQFTVNDGSDGIGVYSPVALPGFTVNEGDEVRIIGSIDQFNGLTQIYADSAKVLSQGNPIPSPVVVAALGESTESELVEIQDLSLVDSSQWSGSGSGFNVDVTDGINTYTVRIDNDVDLYSMPAPSGTFHVRGIGGQFDSSSPFDSGYQLLPRYSADVIPAIGLNEFEKSIIAFPNPFTSSLKLNVDQTTEVRIWNTLGALVWSGEINGEVRVRTESWESGLYLIEFTSQNGSETHRVIKR